jgi:hypothetical protein
MATRVAAAVGSTIAAATMKTAATLVHTTLELASTAEIAAAVELAFAADSPAAMGCLSAAEWSTTVEAALAPAFEMPGSVAIAKPAPFKAPTAVKVTIKAAEAAVAVMEPTESRSKAADEKLRMPEIEAIPRTNADKESVHEIFRSPISVGCALIRVVRVVSPITYRRATIGAVAIVHNRAANLNTNCNLRMGVCRWKC